MKRLLMMMGSSRDHHLHADPLEKPGGEIEPNDNGEVAGVNLTTYPRQSAISFCCVR